MLEKNSNVQNVLDSSILVALCIKDKYDATPLTNVSYTYLKSSQ